MGILAQIIAEAEDDRGTLPEQVGRVLPWMRVLSEPDRETCAQELAKAARDSVSGGRLQVLTTELTAWKETATAVAAGLGRAEFHWLDEDIAVVERP